MASTIEPMPPALDDRLLLVAASGFPQFRPVYDALSRIEVYNLNPRAIAAMQKPDPGELLRRDGSNAASVFHRMSESAAKQIRRNLAKIVPGISDAEVKTLGQQETIEFRQSVKGQQHPWRFLASAMSDGTLRAFAVLLAVFQSAAKRESDTRPLLIGLEEPEIALHPAAAQVLLSALRQGAKHCQIIVTSHSPELLDNPEIPAESILAVENDDGLTCIAEMDDAGKKMLRERLFTPGELLRQNQISPNKKQLREAEKSSQLNFFSVKS